jgi:antitoxin (DNA-binding transcriptional repressor) of toxin-antitoxin stability system
MVITATEFKTNFGKYLDMLSQEDIFITRNGKTIAKVINPQVSAVNSIRGILKTAPTDLDTNSIREERLEKYEDNV